MASEEATGVAQYLSICLITKLNEAALLALGKGKTEK